MRELRITSLQWAVGVFCVVLGLLILVVSQQLNAPALAALQPYRLELGCWLTLSGLALFTVAALRAGRALTAFAHLAAGGALFLLVWSAMEGGAWGAVVASGVLAVATVVAPWVARSLPGGGTAIPRDFTSIVGGVMATLYGLFVILLPDRLGVALEPANRSLVTGYGALLVAVGLPLLLLHLGPPASPALARAIHMLFAVGLVGAVLALRPASAWVGVAMAAVGGTAVALVAWPQPPWLGWHPTSLRARLAVLLAVTAAVPLTVLTAVATDQAERAATEAAVVRQQKLADELAQYVADYVGSYRAVAASLAGRTALLELSTSAQRDVLRGVNAIYPDVLAFALLDAGGNTLARSDDEPPRSAAASPLFQQIKDTREPGQYIGFSTVYDRPLLFVDAPILSASGEFQGALAVVIDPARLGVPLRRSANPSERAFLVDETGRMITTPDGSGVPPLTDLGSSPPVRALLSATGKVGTLQYTEPDGPWLAAYARTAGLGWGVVVEAPLAAVLAPVRAGRELVFVLLLLAIVVAGA